jgi:hypothetical protein
VGREGATASLDRSKYPSLAAVFPPPPSAV